MDIKGTGCPRMDSVVFRDNLPSPPSLSPFHNRELLIWTAWRLLSKSHIENQFWVAFHYLRPFQDFSSLLTWLLSLRNPTPYFVYLKDHLFHFLGFIVPTISVVIIERVVFKINIYRQLSSLFWIPKNCWILPNLTPFLGHSCYHPALGLNFFFLV